MKKLKNLYLKIKSCLFSVYLKLVNTNKIHINPFSVHIRKAPLISIEPGAMLNIKDHCFFNNHCSVTVLKYVEIGDNCIFGENVKIYDHNHVFNLKDTPIYASGFKTKEVKIGSNCWIGSNVVILPGATIGDNCVIGAGCVISTNIPDNSIVKNKNNLVIEEIRYKEKNE